jgi:DNA-binding NarL/FixJ family response regulator
MSENVKKKVLIIDDDANFLKVIRDALKGYSNLDLVTHQSVSGFDVIDDVLAIHPDILFLDVKLPDVSGALLGDLLKSEDEALRFPVYLISAWKEDELEDLLKEVQVEGFVHKSKFVENILSILEKHFGSDVLKK